MTWLITFLAANSVFSLLLYMSKILNQEAILSCIIKYIASAHTFLYSLQSEHLLIITNDLVWRFLSHCSVWRRSDIVASSLVLIKFSGSTLSLVLKLKDMSPGTTFRYCSHLWHRWISMCKHAQYKSRQMASHHVKPMKPCVIVHMRNSIITQKSVKGESWL